MIRSLLISQILSVAAVWFTLRLFGVVPEILVTVNLLLIVLFLLIYTNPFWSAPVYVLLASMFIFNWSKPALQPFYDIIELGATGVLSGSEMTLLNQQSIDIVINSAFACSSSFLIVLLLATGTTSAQISPLARATGVSGTKSSRWLRLLFALGCAASCVESALYAVHYVRQGSTLTFIELESMQSSPLGLPLSQAWPFWPLLALSH